MPGARCSARAAASPRRPRPCREVARGCGGAEGSAAGLAESRGVPGAAAPSLGVPLPRSPGAAISSSRSADPPSPVVPTSSPLCPRLRRFPVGAGAPQDPRAPLETPFPPAGCRFLPLNSARLRQPHGGGAARVSAGTCVFPGTRVAPRCVSHSKATGGCRAPCWHPRCGHTRGLCQPGQRGCSVTSCCHLSGRAPGVAWAKPRPWVGGFVGGFSALPCVPGLCSVPAWGSCRATAPGARGRAGGHTWAPGVCHHGHVRQAGGSRGLGWTRSSFRGDLRALGVVARSGARCASRVCPRRSLVEDGGGFCAAGAGGGLAAARRVNNPSLF